ncbi:MAG: hypothetical protein BMS9Abin33_0207 [Gammaproteobacteria bacterium]|nr:MAG: hypothetical protein BMS9Abin33_0207 [Gammaproteobacteria bacterium]
MLFIALAPASVIALLLSTHYSWKQVQDLENDLNERGKAIARQLAPACEYGVFSGNKEILQSLANSALREADVRSVTISARSGEVLAQAENKSDQLKNIAINKGSAHSHQAPIYQSEFSVLDYDSSGRQLEGDRLPEQIGLVTVKMSIIRTQQHRRRTLVQNFLITLIGLGITVLIVVRLAKGVVQPVLKLGDAVNHIKSGDYGHRVSTDSGGELALLEDGINSMALALEEAQKRDRERAEDALHLEQIRAQITLESIADGVIATDGTGNIVYLNQVAEQITGWESKDAYGKHLTDVYVISEYRDKSNLQYPINLCLQGGQVVRNHDNHILLSKSKRKYLIEDTASPIKDRTDSIIGAVLVFRDVTEIRHMTRKMEFLAHHDPLTGLLNRNEFETQLQAVLDNARSGFGEHALCYMDLDQFKIVNDTSGHIAGDELLKQLALLLEDRVRSNDVLARLGGDEFGIIIEECSVEEAAKIADTFKQLISDFRFSWKSRTYEIGVSIGLVPITAGSGSITDLLSAADSACYIAKDKGRNYIHVYQEDDVELAKRHGEMQWVQRLKEAIKLDHLVLYCQKIIPITESGDGKEMYEILLRVQDTSLILPEVFMPAAERYYLMPDIDRWVIKESFKVLKGLFDDDKPRDSSNITRFSINLSGQSICDDKFLDYVLNQFETVAINPARICFEITETAAIENLTRAQKFITALKKLGCKFALDDFGSGLSSFGYLKSLPVDYIKIDGAFISDVKLDPIDAAMVGAINEIGHIMGLTTVAESVEDIEILEMLKEIKIDYAQGIGISPVMPLSELISSWYAKKAG